MIEKEKKKFSEAWKEINFTLFYRLMMINRSKIDKNLEVVFFQCILNKNVNSIRAKILVANKVVLLKRELDVTSIQLPFFAFFLLHTFFDLYKCIEAMIEHEI